LCYAINYTKNVLDSDLAYLEVHFKKIQNGQSVRLAEEFKGFLKEKVSYYEDLPTIVSINSKKLDRTSKEVARGLKKCAKLIKTDPKNWDTNASPTLSLVYFNMKKLIESF